MNRRVKDDARAIAAIVLEAMAATDVPIDSCIMASEIAREAARSLGYEARLLPCRVRVVSAPDGVVTRDLGYAETVEPDRYNGHAVTLIEKKLILDITAAQIADGIPSPLIFETGLPVKLDRWYGAKVGEFYLQYTPFNDGGDWARGVDGETARDMKWTGAQIAARIRKGK